MELILLLAGLVVSAWIGSWIGSWIAGQKGRSGAEGAVLGFFLGPIGWIIEALLPTQDASDRAMKRCPDCAEDVFASARICPRCRFEFYSLDDDEPAANAPLRPGPSPTVAGIPALYDLALSWQDRSQESAASLVDSFQAASRVLAGRIGDISILDDGETRLWLRSSGRFEAEVAAESGNRPAGQGTWSRLTSPVDLVRYFEPSELFADLAGVLGPTEALSGEKGALCALSLAWVAQSEEAAVALLSGFQHETAAVLRDHGDIVIADDEQHRLWFRSDGHFEAEVAPGPGDVAASSGGRIRITDAADLARHYDPTDLFGDLAEAIAEEWPEVAPEFVAPDRS